MSFCEHCEGQRFDRARVLRTLRQLHKELRATDRCAGEAVNAALHAIRTMDIPHLEIVDEAFQYSEQAIREALKRIP